MLVAASAPRTCPVCGSCFTGGARKLYDNPVCGRKAARLRNAEERRATRTERYERHLKLGGSSTPLL